MSHLSPHRPPTAHPRRAGEWRHLRSLDDALDLLRTRGREGRATRWAHSLHTAALAHQSGAREGLITAALLHNIGQAVNEHASAGADPGWHGVAPAHEELAAALLAPLFPPAVTEPIRLHVQAQRYLATTQPASLVAAAGEGPLPQGGPMTEFQRARFMMHRHAGDALRLGHWNQADRVAIDAPRLFDLFRGIAQRSLRAHDFA